MISINIRVYRLGFPSNSPWFLDSLWEDVRYGEDKGTGDCRNRVDFLPQEDPENEK